jgi:hypothetical protein
VAQVAAPVVLALPLQAPHILPSVFHLAGEVLHAFKAPTIATTTTTTTALLFATAWCVGLL